MRLGLIVRLVVMDLRRKFYLNCGSPSLDILSGLFDLGLVGSNYQTILLGLTDVFRLTRWLTENPLWFCCGIGASMNSLYIYALRGLELEYSSPDS